MTRRKTTWALTIGALCVCLLPIIFLYPPSDAEPSRPAVQRIALMDLGVTGGADITTSAITASTPRGGNGSVALRVTVAFDTTDSGLDVKFSQSGKNTYTVALNSDVNLTANQLYTFTFSVHQDWSVDFQADTSTTIAVFLVEEIPDGSN